MAERTCAACDCKLEGETIQVRIGGKAVEVCCEDCAHKLREAQASTADSRAGAARGRALSVIAVCALAAFGSSASEVRAESPDSESKAVRVTYADLNLQTDAGVEKLYARIGKAAREVCAQNGARLTATTQQRFTKCVDASMSTAARSVNNASLTNLLASAAHGR
jgi:UrcA family protein